MSRTKQLREKLGINQLNQVEESEAEAIAVVEKEFSVYVDDDYLIPKFNNQVSTYMKMKEKEAESYSGRGSGGMSTFR